MVSSVVKSLEFYFAVISKPWNEADSSADRVKPPSLLVLPPTDISKNEPSQGSSYERVGHYINAEQLG